MKKNNVYIFEDRGILYLNGEDTSEFLQNLVTNDIQKVIKTDKDFRNMAKKNNLEIKGVKPFTRILPDSSDLPIPLISKIFDSELYTVNIETRGPNEIIIAQTVEIIDSLVKNKKELEDFSTRVKDDITIDLLAQFSEALRKKYKITINDDVIDQ